MDKNREAARLHQLIDEEWDNRMEMDPLFATYCGDHRFNDQLPKAKEEDFEARKQLLSRLAQQLDQIDASQLPETEKLNLQLFARTLHNEFSEIDFKAYTMPLSKAFGFHLSFPELYQFVPLNNAADYENYISRLEGFDDHVSEQIDLMRRGVALGFSPPLVTLEGIYEAIEVQIVSSAEDSPLFEPFISFPAGVTDHRQRELTSRGRRAITDSVSPAFEKLKQFLVEEYLGAARQEIGASSLPKGDKFYRHRIRLFTSSEKSAQEIHNIGQEEVSRIHEEMDAAIERSGFQGTFKEFTEFLRNDPQFYAQSEQQLLKEVALILKRMDGELPGLFGRLPRMPYGIRPIPEFSAPGNTTAYYFPPSGDGTKAGIYYVNTYDLPSRPLYEIEALSLHEAVPGHHLQIALQQEIDGIPNFRRFDYLTSTAFVEGWALYSERLGLEVGFYTDPYSDFGRLSYEMWRACRLVVDTGIHALGWSRQQAISYMAKHTSLSELNIINEVDRYIAWPGQALAYKMGELKMRELREKAAGSLKSDFDLRAFHDMILEKGAVPLDFLDAFFDSWIGQRTN